MNSPHKSPCIGCRDRMSCSQNLARAEKMCPDLQRYLKYPQQRNLDGIYYRVKRDGTWETICFSDMTEQEMREHLARMERETLLNLYGAELDFYIRLLTFHKDIYRSCYERECCDEEIAEKIILIAKALYHFGKTEDYEDMSETEAE